MGAPIRNILQSNLQTTDNIAITAATISIFGDGVYCLCCEYIMFNQTDGNSLAGEDYRMFQVVSGVLSPLAAQATLFSVGSNAGSITITYDSSNIYVVYTGLASKTIDVDLEVKFRYT